MFNYKPNFKPEPTKINLDNYGPGMDAKLERRLEIILPTGSLEKTGFGIQWMAKVFSKKGVYMSSFALDEIYTDINELTPRDLITIHKASSEVYINYLDSVNVRYSITGIKYYFPYVLPQAQKDLLLLQKES